MTGKPGDEVVIETKDDSFKGILMPEQNNTVVLKLKSGYNVSINKDDVKKIEVTKEAEDTKTKKTLIQKNSKLPNITILHTGGTIASKVDYRTGGVVSKFEPEDLLEMFPELRDIANFDSKLISNMWSDDLRFCHFEKIAKAIESEAKKDVKGIIIGMGTDNLAVASAALSFVFEEVNIPIIFVGAQRSSDRGSSDAASNLICAAEFITKTKFKGVALCMHENTDDNSCVILPAAKTKKLHSSRRDAFKPVNVTPIARVDYDTREVKFLQEGKCEGKSIKTKTEFEEKVGLLKIHVNMQPEEFAAYKNYKGLVIEGTGLGHTPLDVLDDCTKVHDKIKDEIKKLTDNGCIIVMTTTCTFGRVDMDVYSKGRDLQELGVIPGEDMLPETAFIKLAWLLGNYKPEEVKELITKNLRGELANCTDINSYL